jgi:RNA polymerase sigma factor (sigma-70 family)
VGGDDSDERLVARFCQSAEDGAFGQLVARHRDAVFRIALSVMGPGYAGEAEEIAQEVFLRVHASRRQFRGNAKFGSWLYRIAFNQALNVKARMRYKSRHVSYETLTERPASEGDPAQSA